MKTAAVIIDKWKLAIFTKHLKKAGYSYETAKGVTKDTWTLKVTYAFYWELKPIIEAAQTECAAQEAP